MIKKKPLVSVLMPCYNNRDYVGRAIESILNQTYKKIELIIVDDFSDDDSWDIIKEYEKKDPRVRIFRNNKNINIAKTRNKLLSKVSPKAMYIALLDADDLSLKDRLERQVCFLEKNKDYAAVGTQLVLINEGGRKIGVKKYPRKYSEIKKKILHFNPFAQSSMMIRKSAIDEVGLYDEKMVRSEDYDLWIRIILRGYKMGNLSDFLTKYRVHKSQGKYLNSQVNFLYSFKVRKRYIFHRELFSLKAFVIMMLYLFAALMPAGLMVYFYKKFFIGK